MAANLANHDYGPEELRIFARLSEDLGWRYRFVGIGFGNWGIYWVVRRRECAPPTPGDGKEGR